MTIPTTPHKWQNPFISKLSKHNDIIFTCSRDTPQTLAPVITAQREAYADLIIELCSGSGGHLIELSSKNPSALCIGIELRYKRLVRTAEKAKQQGVNNLRILQVDAQAISEVLPKQSCHQIYINFPDPWDGKNRWEDKYLLSKSYLGILNDLLKPNGSFNYKTDHHRRFNQVHSSIQELNFSYQICEYSEDLHNSEYNCNNILTEFERLFSSQKKPVFYLKAIKTA